MSRPVRALTPRQREVLALFDTHQREHRPPPTVRHVGQRLGVAKSVAHRHLIALERKGGLARRPIPNGAGRAYQLPASSTTT